MPAILSELSLLAITVDFILMFTLMVIDALKSEKKLSQLSQLFSLRLKIHCSCLLHLPSPKWEAS